MLALRSEIDKALCEYAWRGYKLDEATFLVQRYCYSGLSFSCSFSFSFSLFWFQPPFVLDETRWTATTEIAVGHDRLGVCPVDRTHLRIDAGPYGVGADGRFAFVREFSPPDGRFLNGGCGGLALAFDGGRCLLETRVGRKFAVDESNGDVYVIDHLHKTLSVLSNGQKEEAKLRASINIRGARAKIRGAQTLHSMFAHCGFVLVEVTNPAGVCQTSIYDRDLVLRHQFELCLFIGGFDAVDKFVIARDNNDIICRYDFDGKFQSRCRIRWSGSQANCAKTDCGVWRYLDRDSLSSTNITLDELV